jgi:HEAT repeat protein
VSSPSLRTTTCLALCLWASAGYSQPRPTPRRPAPAAPLVAAQTPPLSGSDVVPEVPEGAPDGWDLSRREAVLEHIRAAGLGNPAAGARSVAQALLVGLDPETAAQALDTLAALARPEGSVAVLRFLEHRRPSLRRHAIVAAQAIATRPMARALEDRLGDPDATVRADAAMALAEVGDARSLPRLWSALDRDLTATLHPESGLAHGCVVALARRGGADDVARLVGYLRRAPFAAMADGLRAALARRDLDDALKMRVVRAMADLSTPEVQAFLNQAVEAHRGPSAPWVEFARAAAARIQ